MIAGETVEAVEAARCTRIAVHQHRDTARPAGADPRVPPRPVAQPPDFGPGGSQP